MDTSGTLILTLGFLIVTAVVFVLKDEGLVGIGYLLMAVALAFLSFPVSLVSGHAPLDAGLATLIMVQTTLIMALGASYISADSFTVSNRDKLLLSRQEIGYKRAKWIKAIRWLECTELLIALAMVPFMLVAISYVTERYIMNSMLISAVAVFFKPLIRRGFFTQVLGLRRVR